jgi:hypothetical protein
MDTWQVKNFSADDGEQLEQKINQWLQENCPTEVQLSYARIPLVVNGVTGWEAAASRAFAMLLYR